MPEDGPKRPAFGPVQPFRAVGAGEHQLDVRGFQTGVGEGVSQSGLRAAAIRMVVVHLPRVTPGAVADDLGQDLCPPGAGVFVFFQDHGGAAFADDEAAAVFGERT